MSRPKLSNNEAVVTEEEKELLEGSSLVMLVMPVQRTARP